MKDFYDELLNDCYGEIKLGNLVFSPAEIIKRLDPVAYNQGLLDFEDTMRENVREEKDEMISQLNEEKEN
jgi:uncharacterized protein (DUF2164 family)